jgi:hypothetical protein
MAREFQIRKFTETVDQASLIANLVRSGEKGRPVCDLLAKLSEHDVALAAINAQLNVRLVDRLTEFYSRQWREYQDVLRIGKLFGFRKWERIASEASALAWKDAEMFILKIDQIREITEKMVSGMRKDLMKSYVKQINHLLDADRSDLPVQAHGE